MARVLFGSEMTDCATGEIALAESVAAKLAEGMLCLAGRNFFGFELWTHFQKTGADMLWRIKNNLRFANDERLPDGSYLSYTYPSERDWRRKTNGVPVRVVNYRLEGIADAELVYRLVTTILDHEQDRRLNWPPSIMNAGRSRRRLMNSRPICVAPGLFSARRRPTWCDKNSMA